MRPYALLPLLALGLSSFTIADPRSEEKAGVVAYYEEKYRSFGRRFHSVKAEWEYSCDEGTKHEASVYRVTVASEGDVDEFWCAVYAYYGIYNTTAISHSTVMDGDFGTYWSGLREVRE